MADNKSDKCCKGKSEVISKRCDELLSKYKSFEDEKGNKYCLFHAPTKIRKYKAPTVGRMTLNQDQNSVREEIVVKFSAIEFNEIFFEWLDKNIESEKIHLQEVIFPGDIKFVKDGRLYMFNEIDFSNSVFQGEFDGGFEFNKRINMSGVTFEKKVNFMNIEVQDKEDCVDGLVSFMDATFNDEVIFDSLNIRRGSFLRVKFNSKVDFIQAHFSCSADFTECEFNGFVNFRTATFSNDVVFRDTKFNGDVDLAHTHFISNPDLGSDINRRPYKVEFDNSKFSGSVDFEKAEFGMKTSFQNTIFKEKAYFYNSTFKEVNFDNSRFYERSIFIKEESENYINKKNIFQAETKFTNCRLSSNIDFENINFDKVKFLGSDIGKMDFVNCTLSSDDDKLYDELCLNDDSELEEIKKVESLYRQLKERNTRDQHWPRVSKWHYREKELSHMVEKKLKKWSRSSFLGLYNFLSGYNEKPLTAFCVLLSLLILLSLGLWVVDPTASYSFFDAMEYLPFININEHGLMSYFHEKSYGSGKKIIIAVGQIGITVQFALFLMSVRNKLRR